MTMMSRLHGYVSIVALTLAMASSAGANFMPPQSCCGKSLECCVTKVLAGIPQDAEIIYDPSCTSGGIGCNPDNVACCRFCYADCSTRGADCFECPKTPSPSTPSTPAPTAAKTPAPVVTTPAPVVTKTPAPVVPQTPAPVTPAPTVEKTPSPVVTTPQPVVPKTPSPTITAAPVTPGGCCTTDADCKDLLTPANVAYNAVYNKGIECNPQCSVQAGLWCNMFDTCQNCRGCFNDCAGAAKFLAAFPAQATSSIYFCSGNAGGLTSYPDDC